MSCDSFGILGSSDIVVRLGSRLVWFDLWLVICEGNLSADFLKLIEKVMCGTSDRASVLCEAHVGMRERRSAVCSVSAYLLRAYGLCEYKISQSPAYMDLASGYECWGFCDIDNTYFDLTGSSGSLRLESCGKFLTLSPSSCCVTPPRRQRPCGCARGVMGFGEMPWLSMTAASSMSLPSTLSSWSIAW